MTVKRENLTLDMHQRRKMETKLQKLQLCYATMPPAKKFTPVP